MGLDDSTVSHLGQLLIVRPLYGWGWTGNAEAPAPPAEFAMRLVRVFSCQGERRGGVGKVEHPGHPLDGLSVVFTTRVVGSYNFTDRPGDYNVMFGPNAPVDKDGWPLLVGSPSITGFGQVVALIAE